MGKLEVKIKGKTEKLFEVEGNKGMKWHQVRENLDQNEPFQVNKTAWKVSKYRVFLVRIWTLFTHCKLQVFFILLWIKMNHFRYRSFLYTVWLPQMLFLNGRGAVQYIMSCKLYLRKGSTKLWQHPPPLTTTQNRSFANQTCSKDLYLHHVITGPAQTFITATKPRSSCVEVFHKKGFLKILQVL